MRLQTNCTNNRKVMVKRLAEHLGVKATYLKVPSCGYRIGELTVDREAVIAGSPDLLKQIVPLLLEHGYIREVPKELLNLEVGTAAEESAEENVLDAESSDVAEAFDESDVKDDAEVNAPDLETESAAAPATAEALDNVPTTVQEDDSDLEANAETSHESDPGEGNGGNDGNAEADAETYAYVIPDADEEIAKDDDPDEADLEADIPTVNVSIPLDQFTATSLTNFLKLVYARQSLIAAMTQSNLIHIDEELMDLLNDEKPDSVEKICEMLQGEIRVEMVRGIDVAEDKLTMVFPFDEADPTRWKHYSALMLAIAERAKVAHHVSGKLLDFEAEEEKYYCRNWLIQLGLGGTAHKETQRVLLKHLQGYAAFRSKAQMDAHKDKYAALRKEQQEETGRAE